MMNLACHTVSSGAEISRSNEIAPIIVSQASLESGSQLRTVRAFFNNGEFFRSYDLAKEAMERFPHHIAFAHLAVLSLANAGAIELALEKFHLFGLAQSAETEPRALLARLYKDLGFSAALSLRLPHHQRARDLYLSLYREALAQHTPRDAYYPGINAAALSLWCGDPESATLLALEILSLLQTIKPQQSSDDLYWRRATETEADLILSRFDRVRHLIPALRQLAATNHAQIATTQRQLRRIADHIHTPPGLLDGLTPPSVTHFAGHIIAGPHRTGRLQPDEEESVRDRIASLLARQDVGSGYGSLAAGADILFAEALLARGAALHVVFPFPREEFIRYSVAPSGPSWIKRFDTCLAAAQSVHYATEDNYLQHESLFQYCSQLAMGLAVLAARHMQSRAMQCVVWDGRPSATRAGTVVDMDFWRSTGHPQHIVPCGSVDVSPESSPAGSPAHAAPAAKGREIRAMLFGDLHGFSRLTDRELPLFAEHIMGPVAEVVRTFRPRMSFINTWGDGIFAVFEDVCSAAAFALAMQQRMQRIDLPGVGLPAHLRLRLGGHLGPVYALTDPVLERINYYGAHVSRAARIEPVTPEGCVYVTETFASVLALQDATSFACDYAGFTEMAKHYGQLRIFLLRPATGDTSPTVLTDIERKPLV